MRGRIAALSAAVAVVAGGGAAYVATHPSSDGQRSPRPTPPATAVSTPSRTTPLSELAAGAPAPTVAGVRRALRRVGSDTALGGALAALVIDARTGDVLFSRRASGALPPASTAKLLTAAAALHTLGPDDTIATTVFQAGRTLYLRGNGDVTLTARPARTRPGGDLQTLARRVVAAAAPARYRLRYDTSAWSGPATADGWTPAYLAGSDVAPPSPLELDEGRQSRDPHVPRVDDPALQAATAFARALTRAGLDVTGSPHVGTLPAGSRRLASVESAPLGALVRRMLTESDNDLAEALARTVAIRGGGPATFEGAAAAVVAAVRSLGVPTDAVVLHDGSGLSRLDRVTPQALVALLRAAVQRPDLHPVLAGMPVAGLTGTLADRFRSRSLRLTAAGVVRAKTGTLLGVNSLAGQVVDGDGRLLLFALLTDRASDPTRTEDALDRIAGALARCGCR